MGITIMPDLDALEPIGSLSKKRWVIGMLLAVSVLNVIDAALTLVGHRMGYIEEANPLLHIVIESAAMFLLLKFFLTFAGVTVLWVHRLHPWSIVAAAVALVAYVGVTAMHAAYWLQIGWGLS
jgi:hypothetical protein